MPRVQLYPEQLADLARTTNARFAAADNNGGVGSALGAGLRGLGGALSDHADVMAQIERAAAARAPGVQQMAADTAAQSPDDPHADRDEADFHATRQLELDAAQQLQALANGVKEQRGFAAASALHEARRAVDQLRLDMMQNAPTRTARAVLGPAFDHRVQIFDHDLTEHAERQKLVARLDLSRRRQALAEQDALAATTPLAFDTHAQTAANEIDEQARLTGMDAESAEAAKARMLSGLERARLIATPNVADQDEAPFDISHGPDELSAGYPDGIAKSSAGLWASPNPFQQAGAFMSDAVLPPQQSPETNGVVASGSDPKSLPEHAARLINIGSANSNPVPIVTRWAREKVHSTEYQLSDPNRNIGGRAGQWLEGRFAPKCNVFVGDAYAAAGISLRDPKNPALYLTTKAWGDPKSQIAGFRPLKPGEKLQPGDIVTNGHHMGIYVPGLRGKPMTVSAATPDSGYNEVVHNDWGFRGNEGGQMVRWRYVGGANGPPAPPPRDPNGTYPLRRQGDQMRAI